MNDQHPRFTIRNKIYALLLNKTPVNEHVFISNHLPLFQKKLPCILIQTEEETSELYLQSPRTLKRQLTVVLTGLIESNDELPNKLDELAYTIESIIADNYTLDGLVSDSLLTGTTQTI